MSQFTPAEQELLRHLKQQHGRIIYGAINQGRFPADRCAVTFRPGDYTDHFFGKRYRPVGASVMVALGCEHDLPLKRMALTLLGYKRTDYQTDWQEYGAESSLFHFNGIYQPKVGATGRRLDPARNPSLVIALLRMFRASSQSLGWKHVRTQLHLPAVMNGYTEGQKPEFCDTPYLRQLAVQKLHIPLARLGHNGEFILNKYLRELWSEQWVSPSAPENNTKLWLLDSRLCSPNQQPFVRFEDFGPLLGVCYANPSKLLTYPVLKNPAAQVYREIPQFESIAADLQGNAELKQLALRRMRQLVTDERVAEMDLLFALLFPESPLRVIQQALPDLRGLMDAYWSECTSDKDLLQAAYFPEEPLWASGACRIQVVKRGDAFVEQLIKNSSHHESLKSYAA